MFLRRGENKELNFHPCQYKRKEVGGDAALHQGLNAKTLRWWVLQFLPLSKNVSDVTDQVATKIVPYFQEDEELRN